MGWVIVMSGEDLKRRVLEIINRLEKELPDAKIALNFSNPLELLVATILAAQCTDERVNQVTRNLFKKYRSAEDYANADINVLEQDIKPTGYYRVKARRIKEVCKVLVEKFNSEVPKTMEGLLSLPGVARKTANIVLTNAYGINEGIIVDTHVLRLAKRLGLTKSKTRERIEKDLMGIVPKNKWGRFADLLIFHGRRVCKARKPNCEICVLKDLCPSRETPEEPKRDD